MEQVFPFHEQIRLERERRGWSQADLAKKAGCDPKTVGRWESGERIPRPYHRQFLYQLFGKDAETFGLLGATPQAGEAMSSPVRCEDWHDAPVVTNLYGRETERDELASWLQDQSCRVIALSGMGGAGKSALVATVAGHVREYFKCIFWRSLRPALPVELLLKQCLGLLSQQPSSCLPQGVDDLLHLLLHYLRDRRCLLVLDNFEAVMQAGQRAGCYREEHAAYGKLIRLFAETRHQSCLVLISREKPQDIVCREGINSPVRAQFLMGIDQAAARELLREQRLAGSKRDWIALIERYSGNPLALQQVSVFVRELFGGSIARFLQEDVSAFGEISELLCQHLQCLSEEEREILYWLAIEREALSLEALRENLAWSIPTPRLLELLDSLRRRSMIETTGPAHFALQAIFKEYATCCLIERAYHEFMAQMPGVWMTHALTRAKSRGYTRENQPVPLLTSLAQRLLATLDKKGIEQRAKHLLATQSRRATQHHDYLTPNILSLLNYAGFTLPAQAGRGKLAVLSPDRRLHAIHNENGMMRELVAVEN